MSKRASARGARGRGRWRAHLHEVRHLREERRARRPVRATAEQLGLHAHVEAVDCRNRLAQPALERGGLHDVVQSVVDTTLADVLLELVVIHKERRAEGRGLVDVRLELLAELHTWRFGVRTPTARFLLQMYILFRPTACI